MKFYGREEELKTLNFEVSKLNVSSRLAVVTGRRRVGKTTLILKACEQSGLPYLYFLFKENIRNRNWLKNGWLKFAHYWGCRKMMARRV